MQNLFCQQKVSKLSAPFLLAAMLVALAGCGPGTPSALFTTAPASVTVAVGAAPAYSVGGGTGPYTATSSSASVATVGLSGTSLTVTGVAAGSASVVVRDSAGSTTTIAVTVQTASNIALFTTAPASVSLAVGASVAQTYSIIGGTAPYSATSSNSSAATASMPDPISMLVTGVAVGSSNVVVRDSTGASVTVAVTVISAPTVALYTSAPSATSVAIGTSFTQTYSIGGGTGPYFVSSSDASTASVALAGGGNGMVVTGLRVGTANVVVQDSVGTTRAIGFTVIQPSTILQLLPAAFTISERDQNTVNLFAYGGVSPYSVFTNSFSVSSVSILGSTVNVGVGIGGTRCFVPGGLEIDSVLLGTRTVTLTLIDSLGASKTTAMTVQNETLCP